MNMVSLDKVSEDFLVDLSEFLGKPLNEVQEEALSFKDKNLREEWDKYGLDIYSKSEKYLYDLFRNINSGTEIFINKLLLVQNKTILDFGGGAATISLLICDKNDVYYYDIEGIITDFAKFRVKKRGKNIKFISNLDSVPDGRFELVIANEVMEHVADLDLEVSRISRVLEEYGTFYYKNGFGSLDIYPMHFDYINQWKPALLKYKLYPIQAHLAVKNGYQSKIRALRESSKMGSGWHGLIDAKSNDPLVAVESKLFLEDYDTLLELYITLIKETGWKIIIATPTHDYTTCWGLIPAISGMVKPPHSFFNTTSPLVCYSRNQIVGDSLIAGGDWTHLWFVDSDVVPPSPYALMRLLQRDKDIISGLYAKKTIPSQWLIWINDQPVQISDPTDPLKLYPQYKDKVLEITGAGAGCLLVKRHVFDKLKFPWFKVEYNEGSTDVWGEDVYFLNKAREIGIKCYIDTSVMCLHYMNKLAYPMSAQSS